MAGNRYRVVSQSGTSVCLCDGVHSAASSQLCSMFFCVPLCTSHIGEYKMLRIHYIEMIICSLYILLWKFRILEPQND